MTIIASLDLLHFIKEKLELFRLFMMSCFFKVGFGRNHYVFLILNDELIEKLALIKRN